MFAPTTSLTQSNRIQDEQQALEHRTVLFALRKLFRIRQRDMDHDLPSMGRTISPSSITHMHPFV
jgi:hypothetical protein